MFMHKPCYLVGFLALSLAGCTLVPGPVSQPGSEPAVAGQQEKGSLKVVLGDYRAQAFEDIKVELKVERLKYYYADELELVATQSAAVGSAAVFPDLAVGRARVTATAIGADLKPVDSESQWLNILPGKQAEAAFKLFIGGTSATDLSLSFGADLRDYRSLDQADGFNFDFRSSYQPNSGTVIPMTLTTDGATTSVTFRFEYPSGGGGLGVTRQVGLNKRQFFKLDYWYSLPAHAVYMDSQPLGMFDKVRHYRWENIFRVGDQDRTYTIDRWVSAKEGLLKETVREAESVLSVLSRGGV